MKHFHGTYKKICDNHDEDYYKEFKEWADRYFYIKHRDETRGLGGIFFDDQNDRDPETIFEFSKECLNNVVNAYGPIIEKHKNDEFTQKQKEWQLINILIEFLKTKASEDVRFITTSWNEMFWSVWPVRRIGVEPTIIF